MNETQAIEILQQHQSILRDTHVVYTSGRHGNAYINKDAIYPHVAAVSALCQGFAEHFAAAKPEIVAAPAIGGIVLAQWTAFHLADVIAAPLFVYAEKSASGGFELRRGYDRLVNGKSVLVVEDILTTGGSLKATIEAVRQAGGNVVGAAALCNRGNVSPADVGNPPDLFALTHMQLETWDEADCPLCRDNVPINTDVGKGREFLERKNA